MRAIELRNYVNDLFAEDETVWSAVVVYVRGTERYYLYLRHPLIWSGFYELWSGFYELHS